MTTARPNALAAIIREELLPVEGVRRFAPNRRFATIFSADSPSEAVYFIDSGFVKLLKRGEDGKEVLLSILGPGEMFGEQILRIEQRNVTAEVMQEGAMYVIPREIFLHFCESHPQIWRLMTEMLMSRQRELQQKIELLCMHDVEYRILHYLSELAPLFNAGAQEYSLPLSQSELASLIGATRETTSTTLNALARAGLIRLGRRLLIVPSAEALRNAARKNVAMARTAG